MTKSERYIDNLESYIREIRDRAQTIQEDYENMIKILEKHLEKMISLDASEVDAILDKRERI